MICQINLSRPEVEGLLTALSRAQQGPGSQCNSKQFDIFETVPLMLTANTNSHFVNYLQQLAFYVSLELLQAWPF